MSEEVRVGGVSRVTKQHEHDVSASVAEIQAVYGVSGKFGGGQIDHFLKGWASDIWAHGKVHYWTRTSIVEVRSRCGLVRSAEWTSPDGRKHPRMHGGGDFDHCKRCEGVS